MLGLLAALALTATPTRVAVPSWTAAGVDPKVVAFFEAELANALRAEGLTVSTAADIATLLGAERQRQLVGCSTDSTACLTELANALGCDATLNVNLVHIDGVYRGVARLLSSRAGAVLATSRFEASDATELQRRFPAVARELAEPLGSSGSRPLVRWVPAMAGVLLGAASGAAFWLAGQRHDALLTVDSRLAGEKLVSEGQALQTGAWVGASVSMAAIVTSVVWLLAGAAPALEPKVSLAPTGLSVGVGGRF